MDNVKSNTSNVWGSSKSQEALRQVAELCQRELSIDVDTAIEGDYFASKKGAQKSKKGILAVDGKIVDDSHIAVKMEIVRCPGNVSVRAGEFFNQLSQLGDKVQLCPPKKETKGESSLWLEMKIKPSPMAISREAAFTKELKHLDRLANILQEELPNLKTNADIEKPYENFIDVLKPVYPLQEHLAKGCSDLIVIVKEINDYLSGFMSVAITAPDSSSSDFALSMLATVTGELGNSLGRLIVPGINTKGLLELLKKAPGIVIVPAECINLGTSAYEMGSEIKSLLNALSTAGKPVIFTGTLEMLQSVLSGGQGGINDPLLPVVCHVPDIQLEQLTRFTVQRASRHVGGIPEKAETDLFKKTLESIQRVSPEKQRCILPVIANRLVYKWSKGIDDTSLPDKPFVSKVSSLSETLAGLSHHPRAQRSSEVQELFTRVMSDHEGLLAYLKEHLLAQDHALQLLVSRLVMESLTRPSHQPIRYCAQGTPGTGKSESAILTARALGIPYVNIDAASMSDYHTASSQLLGSGRGIVMSYQAGRLEQIAKHHTGVLVEISDLDHAVPSVRSFLADLFLQVLESGEAQSATGSMYSCANVIFAFTMNLPHGMDEQVRKGMGFNNVPSRNDVNKRVMAEIKSMLSGAFLSRIGTPVLFEPLDGDSLASILEQSIKSAILSGAQRLHTHVRNVSLEKDLGKKLLASMDTSIISFGARALLEHGRSLAAKAFAELIRGKSNKSQSKYLTVTATSEGEMVITYL